MDDGDEEETTKKCGSKDKSGSQQAAHAARREVREVNVTFMDSEDMRFECGSTKELRVKLAVRFDSFSSCIVLIAPEGPAMDIKWQQEEKPPSGNVTAVKNTSVDLAEWGEEDWWEVSVMHMEHGDEAFWGRAREHLAEGMPNDLLLRAAKEGNADIAHDFITKSHANVGALDEYGRTPLHYAADEGHAAVVDTLIYKFRADVGARDERERTPLHLAADAGHTAVVDTLLKVYADVSVRDEWGNTPLHLAARGGRVAAVDTLLYFPADAGARDQYESTPLHYAAPKGYAAVVSTLLKFRADAGARDEDRWTPLDLAQTYECHDVVVVLEQACSLKLKKENGDAIVTVSKEVNS